MGTFTADDVQQVQRLKERRVDFLRTWISGWRRAGAASLDGLALQGETWAAANVELQALVEGTLLVLERYVDQAEAANAQAALIVEAVAEGAPPPMPLPAERPPMA